MKYVIHKSSRVPAHISYTGPTLDRAGLRDQYKETYDNYKEAKAFADELSKYNPVGFEVSVV